MSTVIDEALYAMAQAEKEIIRLRRENERLLEAIKGWHEWWDDRYDGQPLKEFEIAFLAALGLEEWK